MREIDRIREILRALSTPDLTLVYKRDEVELRPRANAPVRLPLKVIRDRGPNAVHQVSPKAFNLFIDAGPRLTSQLRDNRLDIPALATSSGLLRVRTDSILVDIERNIDLPSPPARSGPKLQGKSELVAEGLMTLKTADDLPSMADLALLSSGKLPIALSVSQTQKVLARLEEDDVVSVDRSKGPKYTQYFDLRRDELLRLWAREYMPGVTRPVDLYITARDPDSVLMKLKRAKLGGKWAISGPSAAQIWHPTLAPGPAIEIWVDEVAWDDVIMMGTQVDSGIANLTVRRLAGAQAPLWFAHHQVRRGIPLVSRARAYVETSAAKGPRFDELAEALFEEIV